MPEPFEVREPWRDVSRLEFDAFPRGYPRPLKALPSLPRTASFRLWLDPTLGQWPKNAVIRASNSGVSLV